MHSYDSIAKAFQGKPDDLDILEAFVEGDIKGVKHENLWDLVQVERNGVKFTAKEKIKIAFQKVRARTEVIDSVESDRLRAISVSLISTIISQTERTETKTFLEEKLVAAKKAGNTRLAGLLDEALEIIQNETMVTPEITHGTNSTGLWAILSDGGLKSPRTLQKEGKIAIGGEGAKFGGKAVSSTISVGLGEAGAGTAFAYTQLKQTIYSVERLSTPDLESRHKMISILLDNFHHIGNFLSRNLSNSEKEIKSDLEKEKKSIDDELAKRRKKDPSLSSEPPFGVMLGFEITGSDPFPATINTSRPTVGGLAGEASVEDKYKNGSLTLPAPPARIYVPADKVAEVKRQIQEKYPGSKTKVYSIEALLITMSQSPVRDAFMDTYLLTLSGLTESAEIREETFTEAVTILRDYVDEKKRVNASLKDIGDVLKSPLPPQKNDVKKVPWNGLIDDLSKIEKTKETSALDIRSLVDHLQPAYYALAV